MRNSKKILLILGIIGTLAFIYSYTQPSHSVYGEFGYKYDLMERISRWTVFFVPVFLLSLLTSPLKNEVYKSWEKFTLYAITFNVISLVLLPEPNGNINILPTPSDAAYYVSGLFFLISLILIAYKSYRLRGK